VRPAATLVLLALLAAGCATPKDPSPGTIPADLAIPGNDVVASGRVQSASGHFLANVSAHNVGARAYAFSQPYVCAGTPWTATLSGPPGEDLVYRNGDHHPSCPSSYGEIRPGGWVNWTANPKCSTYTACDNAWDGRLWSGGEPRPAPAGDYTWRFRFRYYDLGSGTGSPTGDGSGAHAVELEFHVTVPQG
jgi:hypothetical protein